MDTTFDYLVIGAGSAGCALAARLSMQPRTRVGLIEAGGPDKHPAIKVPAAFPMLIGTEYDWDYRTTPQPGLADRVIRCPRGRVLGGCSSINAQVWTRGHREDFDGWAAAGNPGWSYKEVEPYFQRSERRTGSNKEHTYGSDGPLHIQEIRSQSPATAAFLSACAERGFHALPEANVADTTGYASLPATQRGGRRWSAADAYLRGLHHPNLTVLTNLRAERVTFDGVRATGVQVADQHGQSSALTARAEVILSAGAVNSPQLLMLSGIGDPEHLREHGIDCRITLPGVGNGLQDHLYVPLIVHCPQPVTLAAAGTLAARLTYLLRRRGPLTSNVGEAACFLPGDDTRTAPDLELAFLPVAFLDHGLDPISEHAITIAVDLIQPSSLGTVRLRSARATDPPRIDPRYLFDPGDIQTLVRGMNVAQSLLDTTALAPYVGAPWFDDLDLGDAASIESHIRHTASTVYHLAGTCRMGIDADAVVDPTLRVHGADGLRVVDASIMPRITRGHIQAPVVMIAERAADLITGRSIS
ncbi:choline dehydrogenase [Nocardia panacis]|uniref:Choline dehydrogenase n=1 Tax=Nocardia panacis TaxID=2340916 RepID=A0A3A4K082_9NOCA|nr:GMC family oxidoreductase N-terminal domain-containing protein [Nocardia panacis]RJO70633.1 choline dehydrogenase [Nocardia panacis]